MDKNVKIVVTSGAFKIKDLERELNDLFRQGYALSGGVTVLTDTMVMAVVTKPF